MSPQSAGIVAYVVVALGLLLLGAYVMHIVGGARGAAARNDAFLARALAARELAVGEELALPFVAAAGGAHAVWLELALRAQVRLAFELHLALRVGEATVVDGTFGVTFDEDGDARGLPDAAGGLALNTRQASMPGSERLSTVLRVARFDAPPGAQGEVRVRVTAGDGAAVSRARVLVTSGDRPEERTLG